MMIPNIWEHKKCSKPPTRYGSIHWFQSISTHKVRMSIGINPRQDRHETIAISSGSSQDTHTTYEAHAFPTQDFWGFIIIMSLMSFSSCFNISTSHCKNKTWSMLVCGKISGRNHGLFGSFWSPKSQAFPATPRSWDCDWVLLVSLLALGHLSR